GDSKQKRGGDCDPLPGTGWPSAACFVLDDGSLRQSALDTSLKIGWRFIIRRLSPDVRLQLTQPRMCFGARAATSQMILNFGPEARLQLPVQIGFDQLTRRCTCHLCCLFTLDITHSSKRLRARARRDITVPIGKDAASAMSR